MEKKLNSYRGKLSPSQIAKGINVAKENAARLAQDAKLLLDNERFPSAVALAVLSIEEAGKVSILRSLAVARDESDLKTEWKQYHSHTSKNMLWIFPQLVAEGALRLDDFRPLFEEGSEHPYLLDQLKQLAFYTDCLGEKANWSIPREIIDREMASMLVRTAEIMTTNSQVTEREIELWIEHLGPVWEKDIQWMKLALVNWYQVMQEEGLEPTGPNKMRIFIQEGVTEE